MLTTGEQGAILAIAALYLKAEQEKLSIYWETKRAKRQPALTKIYQAWKKSDVGLEFQSWFEQLPRMSQYFYGINALKQFGRENLTKLSLVELLDKGEREINAYRKELTA